MGGKKYLIDFAVHSYYSYYLHLEQSCIVSYYANTCKHLLLHASCSPSDSITKSTIYTKCQMMHYLTTHNMHMH